MWQLNKQGWLLSPNETKKQLLSRKATLEKEKKSSSPTHKAHSLTEKLYDFRLEGVEIFYSKKSITPWQGAVLWSYQRKGENPFPAIQIRKKNIPNEDEILAHELVHAARFAFKEPLFEEMLAYQTSSSKLYKFFGPLFIFEKEPLIYLLISFISFFCTIYFDSLSFLWIPLGALTILLSRLLALQTLFFLAKKRLKKSGIKSPLPLLLRLSDKEIIQTALLSPSKIFQKKKMDLRTQEVLPSYLPFFKYK